ncbi:polysaccharide deacetylase family protein [Brevibacillus reuszeri]|uniref:polysaccharide deacetylase family protein n=1 Tax=Brevibacillus reuszeri TaxID=54915 RepID=UPI00289B5A6A|nr:polysaccharide deacetylase family protein [Brevibacillus reuszeri]
MTWYRPIDKKNKELILSEARGHKRGRLVELFADNSVWLKAYGGTGTLTFPSGKMQILSTGTSIAARRAVLLSMNGAKTVKVRFYVPDIVNLYEIEFYFAHDANMTDYMGYQLRQWAMTKGWNEFNLDLSKFYSTGGGSWSKDITYLQIRTKSNTGTSAPVVFDWMIRDEVQRPNIIFMFDDGWSSQYTEAFKYMGKYSMPGVCAVISGSVGWSGYCTEAQLREMYDNGWDLANHTVTHGDLTLHTDPANIEAELKGCSDWLNARGFTRASNIVAYPFGSFNDLVNQAMQSRRAGRVTQEATNTTPPPSKSQIKTRSVYNTTPVADLKSYIDQAIGEGSTCLFLFHKLVESGASTGIDYLISDFRQVVDYAYSKRSQIDVITFTEWLDSCGM